MGNLSDYLVCRPHAQSSPRPAFAVVRIRKNSATKLTASTRSTRTLLHRSSSATAYGMPSSPSFRLSRPALAIVLAAAVAIGACQSRTTDDAADAIPTPPPAVTCTSRACFGAIIFTSLELSQAELDDLVLDVCLPNEPCREERVESGRVDTNRCTTMPRLRCYSEGTTFQVSAETPTKRDDGIPNPWTDADAYLVRALRGSTGVQIAEAGGMAVYTLDRPNGTCGATCANATFAFVRGTGDAGLDAARDD